ncbi:hypothetical protein JK361_37500 [Streptomyces sp. 5-8]|uniref:Tyr recombinase domain-containing protein n=2 Tax=Streptomyces musisoli TaxID=2802280 RepID=A0ABS1PCU2_9ACTN|nr:hypothetical protein [Streptomyces musisoli]
MLASSLLDSGYSVHEVAERLGHDPARLMRNYTRVNAVRRRQAADVQYLVLAPVGCRAGSSATAAILLPVILIGVDRLILLGGVAFSLWNFGLRMAAPGWVLPLRVDTGVRAGDAGG